MEKPWQKGRGVAYELEDLAYHQLLCETLGKSLHFSKVLFSDLYAERLELDPKHPSGGTALTLALLHLLCTTHG